MVIRRKSATTIRTERAKNHTIPTSAVFLFEHMHINLQTTEHKFSDICAKLYRVPTVGENVEEGQ